MNDVKLIATTTGAGELEGKSPQDVISYVARVSNPHNQDNFHTAGGLLRYCIKHEHWSIFETASMTLEINTNRGIAAQVLRHRSFTYQEFSQRYADPNEMDTVFVTRECRLQDDKNRQNSIPNEDTALDVWWEQQQRFVISMIQKIYKEAREKGIAKEQARAILPEGNTVSRLYVNGTIRSWIHYVELRSANGTQKEHAELAMEIAKAIGKIFPMATEFLDG